MDREFFMTTERLGFSVWTAEDEPLAFRLWGDPQVTRYICASGIFTPEEIRGRLQTEIRNRELCGVQYWPIFDRQSGELAGCCGLRPHGEHSFELGFHLRPEYWGRGLAAEAAEAVIRMAFADLDAAELFAGHNPKNVNSAKVLKKLGFVYTGDEFYPPTGLYHPSYILKKN